MNSNQSLDLCRSAVEALRQARDLVAAFDLYPRCKVARSQRLYTRLQTLEPPRQAPNERIAESRDQDTQRKNHITMIGTSPARLRAHFENSRVKRAA
jgi:hypothetical protein